MFNLEEKGNDTASFDAICSALDFNTQPKKFYRIGATAAGKCRPLIVKSTSSECKITLLRNARRLRNLPDDDPRKKVAMKPDLTLKPKGLFSMN